MAEADRSTPGAIDASELLDRGRWTGYQKFLIFATALTIVLDGVDNQLLPNAVPTLIQEWGQPRRAFTDALAIGPFGMMLGGLFGALSGIDGDDARPCWEACLPSAPLLRRSRS